MNPRFALFVLFLLLSAARLQSQTTSTAQDQITFAQITDAHIFDEGWLESGSDPFRHALDDRTALHWAVDEINRLYLAAEKPEHRISFIVYTGDLGLQNVFFAQNAQSRPMPFGSGMPRSNCSMIAFNPQPGLPPTSSELAEEELIAEFNRLAVRTIFIVPGNNDLIDEQVVDWPRYKCFVDELKSKLGSLPQPVHLESLTSANAVNFGAVRLAGLNSASFKEVLKYSGACSAGTTTSSDDPLQGCPLAQFQSLQKLLTGGHESTPLLLFTHIPDLIDPYRKRPSWQIDVLARHLWEQDACDSQVLGIFTGHFHSADRSLYATNTGTANLALKKCVADKTWVAPPVAVKVQTKEPVQARGFVIVTILAGAKPAVKVRAVWYPSSNLSHSEQPMDRTYFFVVIGVILFAGCLGGGMNYLLSATQIGKQDTVARTQGDPEKRKNARWTSFYGSLLLGIGAAFLVPLFLNMISSELIENIHDADKGFNYPKILVFLGFCLVAAISSTTFIKTISERIVKLAEEAKKEAVQATQQAENAQSKMDPILQSLSEPEESTLNIDVQLIGEERKVLSALANPEYRLRTVAGIVAETGIAIEDVTRVLKSLKTKNLVNSTTVVVRDTEREGFRWFITPEGRKALSQTKPV